jgi:AcrR family transcriptional regulator
MAAMTLAAKAPAERRRRILNAAIDVLRERGFSGTRVADIAAAAGTSPALVLYHFSSLGDVLLEALTSVDEAFYDELGEASAESSHDDPRDQLARIAALAGRGGAAFGDWQLWLEVWVRARHDPQVNDVRRALDARWRDALHGVVQAGLDSGVFTLPDAERASLRLASLMDGLAVQAVLGDNGMTPERMTDVWLEGAAVELGADPQDLAARLQATRD